MARRLNNDHTRNNKAQILSNLMNSYATNTYLKQLKKESEDLHKGLYRLGIDF